ncbi:MAG: serine/threonine protein kinase, partial [Xanthomonadales bacterium]|nr:serine/threonine protein kinase [Xanthomonadales bacterium]
GNHVGRFRVLEEIGHGGMGTVYLAERSDGQFAQRVALKVMSAGAGPMAVERFTLERQILADLDHPNIARLIDGGLLPDGRPYLVMEYVEGSPIDLHCRSLGLRRRVALLLDVCSAVQAAHQRLVVHRDLKPSNILVTREGLVKLLDFGVAKLMDADHPSATVTAARFLTPQYASPEQVRGEP